MQPPAEGVAYGQIFAFFVQKYNSTEGIINHLMFWQKLKFCPSSLDDWKNSNFMFWQDDYFGCVVCSFIILNERNRIAYFCSTSYKNVRRVLISGLKARALVSMRTTGHCDVLLHVRQSKSYIPRFAEHLLRSCRRVCILHSQWLYRYQGSSEVVLIILASQQSYIKLMTLSF